MTTDPRAIRRRFVLLTALRWLGIGPIAPVLVLLLQDRGLDLGQVGLLFALYGGTAVVLELPTGGLADVLGARPVMAVATVASLAALALFLAAHPAPLVLYAIAVLLGIGRALASGPLEAWYVNAVRAVDEAADIRTGLARAGVAEALALALGALVAGVAGRVLSGPLGVDPLTIPVAAAIIATVVFLVALLGLLERVVDPDGQRMWRRLRREAGRAPAVLRDGVALVARNRELTRLVVAMAAGAVPLIVTEVLWQPKIVRLTGDASPTALLGVLGAGIFLAAGVGSGLAPRVGRWFGDRSGRAIVVVVAVQAVVQVGLALTDHLGTFVAAFLLAYLANGAWNPLHAELTHDRVDESRRTTVVSAMSMSTQLSNIAAQMTLIPLAAATSPAVAWIAGGVLALGGVLAVRSLRSRPRATAAVPVAA